jgi:predicted dehydrogenase
MGAAIAFRVGTRARCGGTAERTEGENTMAQKIRVGIVGTGGIARNQHMPAYAKDPDCEIVAVCDVSEKARTQVAEKFGVKKVVEDYHEIASDPDIDAVSVCTPNFMHRDPTVACLEAGKHVMVEKPIATSAKDGADMVRAAKAAGKILGVGLHFRYNPSVEALRRFADEGGFGDVYFARVHALRRRGIPGWGVFGDKEKQGGGPLYDIGVHALYAAMYVMDFPRPVAVSGSAWQKFGHKKPGVAPMGVWDWENFTVEDYAAAFVRLEGGGAISLEAAFCMNNAQGGMNFWIMGDKGGAQMSPCTVYREEWGALTDTTPAYLPKGDAHEREILAFLAAIRGEGRVGVTGEEGLLVQQILDAVYASADAGREVEVEKLEV